MEEHSGTTDGGDSGEATGRVTRRFSAAGSIDNLNVRGFAGVIRCKAGSRRSSHWHKTDSHWLYVQSGRMWYWERPVGSTERPAKREYWPGAMVFTGPGVEHWTEFPEETVLVSVSERQRTDEAHEADLVRVPWHE